MISLPKSGIVVVSLLESEEIVTTTFVCQVDEYFGLYDLI